MTKSRNSVKPLVKLSNCHFTFCLIALFTTWNNIFYRVTTVVINSVKSVVQKLKPFSNKVRRLTSAVVAVLFDCGIKLFKAELKFQPPQNGILSINAEQVPYCSFMLRKPLSFESTESHRRLFAVKTTAAFDNTTRHLIRIFYLLSSPARARTEYRPASVRSSVMPHNGKSSERISNLELQLYSCPVVFNQPVSKPPNSVAFIFHNPSYRC